MVDRELAEREDVRLSTRLKAARLRHNACLEDIDYLSPRTGQVSDPAIGQRPMAARRPNPDHRPPHRRWQNLADLRASAQGLSGRLKRAPPARAALDGRTEPGPW